MLLLVLFSLRFSLLLVPLLYMRCVVHALLLVSMLLIIVLLCFSGHVTSAIDVVVVPCLAIFVDVVVVDIVVVITGRVRSFIVLCYVFKFFGIVFVVVAAIRALVTCVCYRPYCVC